MGEMLSLTVDGQAVRAYAAAAQGAAGAGVLLLHAWWGLTPFMTRLAGRLAGVGFSVLAPDYYGGRTAATIEEAKAARSLMDRDAASRIALEAARELQVRSRGERIGVVAFSLGCGLAQELARAQKAVRCVVLFYGTGGRKFDRVQAAFQGHFAEDDRWGADADEVRGLEERLRGAACEVEFHTYPGTGHWFFEDDRPEAYQPQAAALAWERTVAFLKARLT